MRWVWGPLAALALLWPDRAAGPFDGVPLDRTAEAILVGVVFPALWWFHPRFLGTRTARAAIVSLFAWKVAAATLFVPDGWCLRFVPAHAYVKDGGGAPHAWDLRADWRTADPACSAIMTRPFERLDDFPAWFFNLPPVNDDALQKGDRPPDATTAMTVLGFLTVPEDGILHLEIGADMTAALRVDGGPETGEARLAPGTHTINISASLTGDRWRFRPTFNGRGVFAGPVAPTLKRPSAAELAIRPWLSWIPMALVAGFIGAWIASALIRAGDPALILWSAIASSGIGWLVMRDGVDGGRWTIAALVCAAALPLRSRVRNTFGAFIAIGIPWLTFVVVASLPLIGRFTLYTWGDDWWTFQRYAYRIVMQGYWLEGGSATFWFQPLYRWIAGLLHVVFGDSSVGEWYWDGACLLAGSLFSYHVVRRYGGFRWGLIAAVAPIALVAASHERVFLGRGLSEISSAGLIYLAASLAMRSRRQRMGASAIAGLVATLGFYTRLNLPFAVAVAAFAVPLSIPVAAAFRPWPWLRRVDWRTALGVTTALGLGLLLFAWRTWHYTGVFSVTYGTARGHLAVWQAGLPIGEYLRRATGSVMMVLTLNDPARYDPYALPVLGGAAVAVLSLIGVPRLRTVPLALVLFFVATLAGALVARGTAYAGRFSLHAIPVTCALGVAGIASLTSGRPRRTTRSAGDG